MAGYGSTQVNVGTMVDPIAGISRALTNLSQMYANQSDREQQRKSDEAALKLKNAQEARLQKSFDNAEADRLAEINFNKWGMSDAAKNFVFDTSTMNKDVLKHQNALRSAVEKEQEEFRNSLLTGNVSTDQFNKNLLRSNIASTEATKASATRASALKRALGELGTLKGSERTDKINEYVNSMYKDRFDALDSDIKTGTHLSNAERSRAILNSLDPEMVSRLPFERVMEAVKNRAGGFKVDDLAASEAARAAKIDEASKYNINNAVKMFNSQKGNKNSTNYTSKDLDKYVEYMGNIDIGPWDSSNARKAGLKLLEAGHHPSAIVSVIEGNINRGVNDTFFDPDDKDKFRILATQSDTLSKQLGVGSDGQTVVTPGTFKAEPIRSIDDIRKMRMRYTTNKRFADFAPKEVASKDTTQPTVSSNLVDNIPDGVSREVLNNVSNSYIKDGAFNPTKDAIMKAVSTQDKYRSDINKKVQDYINLPPAEKARAYDLLPEDIKEAVKSESEKRSLSHRIGRFYGPLSDTPKQEYDIDHLSVGDATPNRNNTDLRTLLSKVVPRSKFTDGIGRSVGVTVANLVNTSKENTTAMQRNLDNYLMDNNAQEKILNADIRRKADIARNMINSGISVDNVPAAYVSALEVENTPKHQSGIGTKESRNQAITADQEKMTRNLGLSEDLRNKANSIPKIQEDGVIHRNGIYGDRNILLNPNKPVDTGMTPTMKKASKAANFIDMIATAESSNNSKAVNGQYLGKYQMGNMALQDAGYKDSKGNWTGKNGVTNKQEYLDNEKAQTEAFNIFTNRNVRTLNNLGAMNYVGKVFKGVPVTAKGLMAAAHLVGATAVANMLKTGIVPSDGNGTKALAYLQMGSR